MKAHTPHAATPLHTVKEKIWTRDFVLVCLANFFVFLGFQMTLPTIPLYVEKLGGSDHLIGLVVGVFTISAIIVRPWSGHALESKGRRIIYLTGLAIFVVSVGSYALTASLFFLFAMRMLQGGGWGLSTTAGGTVATDIIPPHRRGEGMGYFGLSGNIAMAFGPALALALVSLIDFPKLFMLAAGCGAVAFLLASFIHYRQVEHTEVPRKKWDVFEKAALQPALLLFFITTAFGGIATFLPLYTEQQGVAGIEWYFFFFATSMMITRTFSGRIYDLKGHRAVFIPGASLIICAMLFLTFLSSEWMLIVAALMYGTGFGAVQPALMAWAIDRAPHNRKGMANATFFSAMDLGVGFGAIVFGFIANAFSYNSVYATSALFVSLSIILYVIILRKEKDTK